MFTKRIGNDDNLIKEITDRILLKLKKKVIESHFDVNFLAQRNYRWLAKY